MMLGQHTTGHAPGALSNGTRVRKTLKRIGDAHAVGAFATIVGSMNVEALGLRAKYFYFVEWDDFRGVAVGIAGDAIAPLE